MSKHMLIIYLLTICSCGKQGPVISSGNYQLTQIEMHNRDHQQINPKQYSEWVQNPGNGFIYSKSIDGISYSLFCKPIEYIISQESTGEILSEEMYNARKHELNGMYYFDLKITVPNF